ncbi:hypothetical protein COT27_02930 [Candidatus Kuenenbacteria bacterium CG08_land_8_20_14_0_20_37_23]|uniref:ABC transporter ATP-binding protein n=2 Tax=Candidatus Kueneniibacteriota TaxID=1752740 RepID=A0A2M6XS95_9BACT|nr:MAG: hypothetical protein AUJ29_01575 [Candidatus Kuenenbacteria bacterium CG1_02_38_13]PIU10514.1 MAG: hypothetical protein COT27_02930 [Candidatus Kuenenbacteria bacterium CG08_land_8_20_14_0_20_37_23]
MINDKRISAIIKLSTQAFSPYKWHIIGLIVLSFIAGIFEGIGVNALIPLFSFALGGSEGGTDIISRTIERFFNYFGAAFNVTHLLIFISLLFIFKAIFSLIVIYIKTKINNDYGEQTRTRLFQSILKSNWPHLLRQRLGHLETILMVDVPASQSLLEQISVDIMTAVSLFVYIVVAINISATTTLIALVIGAIFFLLLKPTIYRIKILSYERTLINQKTAHHIGENILGMKTVKAMVIERAVGEKGIRLFQELKHITIKVSLLKSITSQLILPVSVIFICVVFVFSYHSPSFNLAVLAAVVYLVEKIFTYIQQLEKGLQNINECVPNLRNVLDYEKKALAEQEQDVGQTDLSYNKNLKFENVGFFYETGRPVLKNLNFVLNKGESVGFIGSSGVGKTTLVDLILRLLTPTSGNILIDGKNITNFSLSSWRKKIGYIAQDMFLINDTIENNIRFYNQNLSANDIIQAARLANIDDFINQCPHKMKTIVGERGIMLSVGQRQRLVIARILAVQPEILILDEATSALDNESELKIQKVIKNLKGKITVLIIAHRLSTVINLDNVIVLDNGMIAEQGAPRELLKNKNSYFHKVYT